VYLRATPETLAARVGEGRDRPLLAGLDARGRVERLRTLLAEREIHYGRAEVVVDTDGLGVDEAAAAVAAALGDPDAGRSEGKGGS
jgi:3-dehydroquinate synthase/shikimate kinase/3-dehydroquinate synthase